MAGFQFSPSLVVSLESGMQRDAHPVTDASPSMMVKCSSGTVGDGGSGGSNGGEVVVSVWR